MRIGATYSQNSAPTSGTDPAASAGAGRAPCGAPSGAALWPGSTPAATAGAVSVTLSSKARQLDQASTSDASEKIARLRAAVSSGQLKIDPDKIAAAIVGE